MKDILIPPQVRQFVQEGAVLAISISGGKDSQALLRTVMAWYRREGLTNEVFAIHADLGRAEWKETPAFVEKMCQDEGVELVVVHRERGGKVTDMVDRWQERREQLQGTGKPFWSSAKQRYCTSDLKTSPINQHLKQFEKVISIEGVRWQESKARSQKPRVARRSGMVRKALTWYAIVDFSIDDVWATYDQTVQTYHEAQEYYRLVGKVPEWWNFHPAYAMGNTRLSCAICVLANNNDFRNGIKHNPELAYTLSQMEEESGFTFRQGKSIAQVQEAMQEKENTVLSLF